MKRIFAWLWAMPGTVLVWAGPAQIILITTLASGATIVQSAIAVTVSAIRLFPMVVAVLPLMRTAKTKRRHLILVAHFTAVTLWVECYRFLPHVPRERRVAFVHGLGCGLMSIGLTATVIGYELAANLSQTLASAILLLTPLAFLFSTARNSRGRWPTSWRCCWGSCSIRVAALMNSGLDILVSGVVGGHHRLWRPQMARGAMSGFMRDFIGDWHALVVLAAWRASSPTRSGGCWACGSAAGSTRARTS